MSFTHIRAGTDEAHWLASDRLRQAGPVEISSRISLVVLVAHPDDETLAAGGLISTVLSKGGSVTVIVASDGENSHPRSPTWTPTRLAEARRIELSHAMDVFGPVTVHWLGQPDGTLAEHEAAITEAVGALLGDKSIDLMAATWTRDAHPDHETIGRVARRLCADRRILLWEMPIWFWHWATDDEPTAPWSTARRLELDSAGLLAKQRAMAAHRTQIEPLSPAPGDEPILPPGMAIHFRRPFELFFVSESSPAP